MFAAQGSDHQGTSCQRESISCRDSVDFVVIAQTMNPYGSVKLLGPRYSAVEKRTLPVPIVGLRGELTVLWLPDTCGMECGSGG